MYVRAKRCLSWILLLIVLAVLFFGPAGAEQAVDLDLSAANRAITYAQMIQVCNSPADYDGMIFRVKGKFNYSELHNLARIIFSDNTGCCELALVFQPAQALTYPDDYPPLYGDIVMTARLTADQTASESSCYFTDAVIEWKK